jgi:putative nucleotidyltransferase with HDIG domain
MLKSIETKQSRVGMYIHDFNTSWMNNPFWKKSLKLKTDTELKKLLASGIKEITIDTSKGFDVLEEVVVEDTVPEAELEEEVDQHIPNLSLAPTTAAEEQVFATKAIGASKGKIESMFADVRMGKAVSADSAMPIVEELTASVTRNQGALISLVRLKTQDDYTYMHSVAVCAMMVALAQELGLSEEDTRQCGLAGLMHDLGKAAIPEDILNKPGKLTDEEFDTVKTHPDRGFEMLVEAGITDKATLEVCLHHHEKVDGSGYPSKQSGDEISTFAKMGAVCDVYDALTSNRAYKEGWEPGIALQRMSEWKGHFDELVFKAFVRSVGIYPNGTLVMLESKQLAVVVEQNEKSLTKPVVNVFFKTKGQEYITPKLVDLSDELILDKIVSAEDPAIWEIEDTTQYWKDL